jgi:hypothetical protein
MKKTVWRLSSLYIKVLHTEPSQGVHVTLFVVPVRLYTWMVPNFLPSCYCAPLRTSHVCRVDSTRSFRIGPLLFTGLAEQKNCLHSHGAHKEEWTSRGKNPHSTTVTVTSFVAASPLLSCFSNSFCNTPATSVWRPLQMISELTLTISQAHTN